MPTTVDLNMKKAELRLEGEPFFFDVGCQVATLYLRLKNISTESSCTHSCPFPQCIEEITCMDKRVIDNANFVKLVYNDYDAGLSIYFISQKHKLKYKFVERCIQKRKRIKVLLSRWSIIINEKSPKFSLSGV